MDLYRHLTTIIQITRIFERNESEIRLRLQFELVMHFIYLRVTIL